MTRLIRQNQPFREDVGPSQKGAPQDRDGPNTNETPDLVLLDTVMPGKSGPDICKELKSDKATRGIPVIIFTAHYPEEVGIKASYKDIGADDCILKPFDAKELLAKIKKLIR